MKLWIALDERIKEKTEKDDVVLVSNITAANEYKDCTVRVVKWTNSQSVNEDRTLSQAVNAFYGHISEDFYFTKNTAYCTFFMPVAAVINEVEEIMQTHPVDTVILIGGSDKPYFTAIHGQGEGNKKWYKSSWLVNPVLYGWFVKNKTVKILWHNKQSMLRWAVRHICRENFFYIKELLAACKRYITYCIKGNKQASAYSANEKDLALAVAMLPLQYRHLVELTQSVHSVDFVFLTPFGVSTNADFHNVTIKPLGFINILKAPFQLKERYRATASAKFSWNNCSFEVGSSVLFRALKATALLACIQKRELELAAEPLLAYKPKYIVTDMTYGNFASLCYKYAREKQLCHLNFQHVAMGKLLYPDLDTADRYYLYSQKTYGLYKKHSTCYRLYMPVKTGERKSQENDTLTVSVFLQPDWFADRYYTFLCDLAAKIMDNGIAVKLLVKPHYRQNKMQLFEELAKRYEFVFLCDRSESVRDVFARSDLMMSMTSSVLFEAVSVGIPGIIIDVDGAESEFISNNDSCFEQVNFRAKSYDMIMDILKEPEQYKAQYGKRREQFVMTQGALVDIEEAFSYEKNSQISP